MDQDDSCQYLDFLYNFKSTSGNKSELQFLIFDYMTLDICKEVFLSKDTLDFVFLSIA